MYFPRRRRSTEQSTAWVNARSLTSDSVLNCGFVERFYGFSGAKVPLCDAVHPPFIAPTALRPLQRKEHHLTLALAARKRDCHTGRAWYNQRMKPQLRPTDLLSSHLKPLLSTITDCNGTPLHLAINGIPSRFRQRLRDHFSKRRQFGNAGLPLLGEVAPTLLVDLLQASEQTLHHPLMVAWWQLYYSVIITDDLLDKTDGLGVKSMLLPAMLLEQRGVATISAHAARFPASCLDCSLAACFDSMAISADVELSQDTTTKRISSARHISIAAQKLSLLEFLTSLMNAVSPQSPQRLQCLRDCMRRIAVMSQLLDDITDVYEDFESNHRTLITAPFLGSEYPFAKPGLTLEHLIVAGSLRDGLELALMECEEAVTLLNTLFLHSEGRTGALLRSLFPAIKSALELIRQVTEGPESERRDSLEALRCQLALLSFMS